MKAFFTRLELKADEPSDNPQEALLWLLNHFSAKFGGQINKELFEEAQTPWTRRAAGIHAALPEALQYWNAANPTEARAKTSLMYSIQQLGPDYPRRHVFLNLGEKSLF